MDDSHDPYNREEAFKKSIETEKYPLGIFYINNNKKIFEESLSAYKTDKSPLYKRDLDMNKLKALIETKK